MDGMPLVSVVTPSYNSAKFIESCIQSVLSQDYPYVEHIVQDGASTDGTVEILKKYTGRVNWVSEPDNGQSDGLNRALQRCRGDIIGVLNADDEYLSHAASWAVENFAKFPHVAVIYGDQYFINADGIIIGEIHGQPYNFKKVLCVEDVIPAQAAFIRRTHFEQVGLFADTTRKTCPDYEMWVRIGLKFPIKHVPGFVARYRLHIESEGCQPDLVPDFVKSKREVMERIFNDPTTPKDIRGLRRRAYSGVVWWGACTRAFNGDISKGIRELFRSLWMYPSIEQVSRFKFFFVHLTFLCKGKNRVWWIICGTMVKALTWFEKGCRLVGTRSGVQE